MPDAIPEEEKSRRLAILQERQRQIQIARNEKLVGVAYEVLVDGRHAARSQWAGRTTSNRMINFTSPRENLLGEYVQVRVTRAGPNSLVGEHIGVRSPGGHHGTRSENSRLDDGSGHQHAGRGAEGNVSGSGILPIWVGIYEANAIALEIEKVQTPRPMTHDLLKNVLIGLNVHVQKVVVSDLKDDTFYALIWMERDGQIMSMDSRPSDALALALRLDCPIFVEDEVLKNSRMSTAVSEKSSNEELRKWLENLNDEDLGRYKM